jgi:CBS domain-containing protein
MTLDAYNALPQARLRREGNYFVAEAMSLARVDADSPAIEVMTDLRRVPVATTTPETTLDEANQGMILRGVRLLLVSEPRRKLTGLLTATDILGEKPVRIGREREMRFSELLVRDVMVPLEQIDAMPIAEVLRARVGHIVATLKHSGRQHALVTETDPQGREGVRGIFSASQIARQLGIPIQIFEIPRTFAEIEAALAR